MELYNYQLWICLQLQCESLIYGLTIIKMKTVWNFEVASDNLNVWNYAIHSHAQLCVTKPLPKSLTTQPEALKEIRTATS